MLHVRKDGSYLLQHDFIGDVIGADGRFTNFFGGDSGSWLFEGGVLVLTAAKIGSDHSAMFLPAYCGRFRLEADGLLVSEATPANPYAVREKIVLRKMLNPRIESTAHDPSVSAIMSAHDSPS